MASGLRVNEDEPLTETFDVRFAAIAIRGWRMGLTAAGNDRPPVRVRPWAQAGHVDRFRKFPLEQFALFP